MFKFEYAIVSSIMSLTTLGLSIFFFVTAKTKSINRLYASWALCVGLWSLFLTVSIFSRNENEALFWCRLLHVWAIFIPPIYVHFVLLFLKKFESRKRLVYGLYMLSLVFVGLNFTPWFIAASYREKFGFYVTAPQILYPIHIVIFISAVAYVYWELLESIFRGRELSKNQVKIFFIATVLGYSGGASNYLINYDLNVYPLYPYGNLTSLLYLAFIGIAIIRHKLMDIEIILRKTVVFAGLLAFVFTVVSLVTFFLKDVLITRLGLNDFWVSVFSIFFIVLGYDPIRTFLIEFTDRYLFQKKYDYQKLLKDASRGISKIENLRHLFSLVVHFITIRMRVKNAAILTHDKEEGSFHLSYQRGYLRGDFNYEVSEQTELIRFLKEEKEAIEIEHVKEYIELGNRKSVKGQAPHEYDFSAIKATMAELDASCFVPSFLGPELRNILVLGDKKSGDFYTEEDLNVLFTLAQESAIAIENARLYDEAIGKTKELEEINSQLEYAKNLLMKALKETEVANKSLQDTQAQLIHEQKMATLGRLAASVGHEVNNPLTILSMNVSRVLLKLRKNPDLKVNEIMDTFEKMEQNIGRIKAVVNTLTGLLKKSEKGKFEPLSLKLILEETLPLVQFQTYLDNLTGTEVEFEVPSNLPLVRGDLERLQEVFLNLFINAYHAMEGRQHRKIRVYANPDPQNPYMVLIHFKDNGKGMTDEIRKKIFNYGYTTKAPGKGSGLGLYMCKYIIELHGGDITVESKVGEGATFIIKLPAATSDDMMHGSSERRASAG